MSNSTIIDFSPHVSGPVSVARQGHCQDCSYFWELQNLVSARERRNEAMLRTLFRCSGYSGPACWREFRTFRPEYETLIQYLALGNARICHNNCQTGQTHSCAGRDCSMSIAPLTTSTTIPPPPYSSMPSTSFLLSTTTDSCPCLRSPAISRHSPRCPNVRRFVSEKLIPVLEAYFGTSISGVQKRLRVSVATWTSTPDFLDMLADKHLIFDRRVLGRRVDACVNQWLGEQRQFGGEAVEGGDGELLTCSRAQSKSKTWVTLSAQPRIRVKWEENQLSVEINKPDEGVDIGNRSVGGSDDSESDQEHIPPTSAQAENRITTPRPPKRARTIRSNGQWCEGQQQQEQYIEELTDTPLPMPPPSSPALTPSPHKLTSSPASACFRQVSPAERDCLLRLDDDDDEEAGVRLDDNGDSESEDRERTSEDDEVGNSYDDSDSSDDRGDREGVRGGLQRAMDRAKEKRSWLDQRQV